MYQEKLREIDQQLIDLLGKRISVLAESEYISIEEQITSFTYSQEQNDVLESVWKNLVINCVAAVTTATCSTAKVKPRRVTLVGGCGLMGRFFKQKLSAAGHYVSVLDRGDWEQAKLLLDGADLVLVCVPIEYTTEVIRKLAQYLAPTTALADIASIKTPIVQTMLELHSGPVMGLHPMFGPGIKSFLSQKVVVCPGREDEAFQWLLDLIVDDGGELVISTPEEHDRMMINVQAIRNFKAFSFGVFLAEEEIDLRRSLDFSSPVFRLEIDIASRLFTQSAPMVVDIILATPERRAAICNLAATYNRLSKLITENDRDTLIQEFKLAQSFLGEDIKEAAEESTYVIDALSTLLAAKEVEQKQSSVECSPSLRDATRTAIANQTVALSKPAYLTNR